MESNQLEDGVVQYGAEEGIKRLIVSSVGKFEDSSTFCEEVNSILLQLKID